MFCSLVKKECKMWLKSIIFYAYVIILFLFYVTQMGSETLLEKPKPNEKGYGMISSSDKNVIMNGTLKDLLGEYEWESFATYPIGFYKEVVLSDSETEQLEKCIDELTGMSRKEWKGQIQEYYDNVSSGLGENGEYVKEEGMDWPLFVSSQISWEDFQNIMKKVENIIGPGSAYRKEELKSHGAVEKTYEQASQEYYDVLQKDRVTGAYARLFSDYLGIILGILPAFFAVTRVVKEKRSKVQLVIYSQKANSFVIVLSRYVGMIVMLFLPVLLVSCFSLTQAVYVAKSAGAAPDYFAYVKYCSGWLLPTILFVTALSYLVAEWTESILSILVNGGVWFLAVFAGSSVSLQRAGWNLIPRFNTVGQYSQYTAMYPQLVKNRILYSVVSMLMVLLAVFIYERKRKGGRNYGAVSKAD